jgi:phosphonate transport system substrate-binding protein
MRGMEPEPTPAARKRTNPVLLVLMGLVPAAIIGYGMYVVQIKKPTEENRRLNSELIYKTVGLQDAAPITLDPRFTDADGDLVADAPTDLKQFIDPPKLTFSYVPTTDAELYREGFKDFVNYLAEKLGRPCDYVIFPNPEAELRALQEGKLYVAGINTGNIPIAVNQCGFVPIYGLASDKGVTTYQMLIIVPSDSKIESLMDLRGKELTLTEPGSNSGFKAPLVLLSKDKNLQPGKDFSIRYSGGHRESIMGVANKTYQAAAVASDVLAREVAAGTIKKDQYRVIYESEDFPTAGFGYVYNLKPELVAKVKEAFKSFQWKGTGVEREFAGSSQTQFADISFKKDFALVRRIDDAIRSVRTIDISEETSTQPATSQPATMPAPTATAGK